MVRRFSILSSKNAIKLFNIIKNNINTKLKIKSKSINTKIIQSLKVKKNINFVMFIIFIRNTLKNSTKEPK